MNDMALQSDRLRLIAATAAMVQAEIQSLSALSRLLQAQVPQKWPPEIMADALPFFLEELERSPDLAGWLTWYWILQRGAETDAVLAGCGGYKGPPLPDGTVEIGCSVLPQFQGKGIATEAFAELLRWALSHKNVSRIRAETAITNTASRRLLEKLGFRPAGRGSVPGMLLFELSVRDSRFGGVGS